MSWRVCQTIGTLFDKFGVTLWNPGIKSKKPAFLRGGNWNNGANAGAFTLNLNNSPANSNENIGFRCARYFLFKLLARF